MLIIADVPVIVCIFAIINSRDVAMLINQKEIIDPNLKRKLQEYVYDVIGVIQDVHNELPQGILTNRYPH